MLTLLPLLLTALSVVGLTVPSIGTSDWCASEISIKFECSGESVQCLNNPSAKCGILGQSSSAADQV